MNSFLGLASQVDPNFPIPLVSTLTFRLEGSSSHSNLYILLKAFTVSGVSATRVALTSLLQHILSESIMFQEDPDEPYLWLASLPTMRRAAGAEAPDGAPLTGEGDSVIVFLDDCVQRCLKTPYRYIDELYALTSETKDDHELVERLDTYPSPLLITIFEQLNAKIAAGLLSPSDVLAITSFVRKLVIKLSSKQQNLQFLRAFAEKVDVVLRPDRLFPQYPSISSGIRREMSIVHACLRHLQTSPLSLPTHTNTDGIVHDFLDQIEQSPIRQCLFQTYHKIEGEYFSQPNQRLHVWLPLSSSWTGCDWSTITSVLKKLAGSLPSLAVSISLRSRNSRKTSIRVTLYFGKGWTLSHSFQNYEISAWSIITISRVA